MIMGVIYFSQGVTIYGKINGATSIGHVIGFIHE